MNLFIVELVNGGIVSWVVIGLVLISFRYLVSGSLIVLGVVVSEEISCRCCVMFIGFGVVVGMLE